MSEDGQRTYEVQGMTCAHCVAAVTDEVSAVPGVEAVDVDLDAGRMVIRGSEIDDEAVGAAVEEAGYSLA